MITAILSGTVAVSTIGSWIVNFAWSNGEGWIVGKTESLWSHHKLKAFVDKEINESLNDVKVDGSTIKILKSKEQRFKPLKKGFAASIFKKPKDKEETWFVDSLPCQPDKLSRIRKDFSTLLTILKARFWNNADFMKLAGTERVQQMVVDEIDSIKDQIRELTLQIEELRGLVSNIQEELKSTKFTLVENVPHPVSKFTGRQQLLDEMQSLLSTDNILFLTGFGGVGKVFVAAGLDVGNRYK